MAAPLVLGDAGFGAPTPKAATEVMWLYRLILLTLADDVGLSLTTGGVIAFQKIGQ
nr:hypothetical protein [Selenomonas ruminantium]